jgi:alpha-1,3-rhamnosyl/mannosyltransferase
MSGRLRVGIDATCLAAGRGYGRFARELLPELLRQDAETDYVLFADHSAADALASLPGRRVLLETSQAQAHAASARGSRRLRDMWRMGRAVAQTPLDVLYFPSVYTFFPVPGPTPVAVAIHDTIPERYGEIVFPTRWNRALWNLKVKLALRRSRGLLTVSEWSRQRIADHFAVAPDEIHVTPEAPARVFTPPPSPAEKGAWFEAQGLPKDTRYFLFVGGFNPHKNLELLIDAFASVAAARSDLQLVFVGDVDGDVFHTDVGSLRERIDAHGLHDRVTWAGYVADETLRHLYAGALALVLPSLEEGFGLPAVEAAACGTASIATRNSPLPQILAGGGVFFDPRDGAALAEQLAAFADEPQRVLALGDRARERAALLTWDKTARATRSALGAIAGEARAGRPQP